MVPYDREMAEPVAGPLECVAARIMDVSDWPGELGPDWPAACAAISLDPAGPARRPKRSESSAYALVLCRDAAGGCWTTITSDAAALSYYPDDDFRGFEPDPRSVIETRAGWLVYVAADAPPTDSDLASTCPAIDTAARRRSLADRVADELVYLQARTLDEYLMDWREEEANWGITDPDPPPPRWIDLRQAVDVDYPGAIPEAIASLEAIASRGELPAGTVRTRPASREAHLVRGTGDTVSLVARTDGPAILLLDEAPGRLLEVGHDHPRVAAVLDVLMAATVRA